MKTFVLNGFSAGAAGGVLMLLAGMPSHAIAPISYKYHWSFEIGNASSGGAGDTVEGTIELMEGLNVGAQASPIVTKAPNDFGVGLTWSWASGGFDVVNGAVTKANASYTSGLNRLFFGSDPGANQPPDTFVPELRGPNRVPFYYACETGSAIDCTPNAFTRKTSSVPGPLPLFGAAAAFGYSRKLRRRIKVASSSPID